MASVTRELRIAPAAATPPTPTKTEQKLLTAATPPTPATMHPSAYRDEDTRDCANWNHTTCTNLAIVIKCNHITTEPCTKIAI